MTDHESDTDALIQAIADVSKKGIQDVARTLQHLVALISEMVDEKDEQYRRLPLEHVAGLPLTEWMAQVALERAYLNGALTVAQSLADAITAGIAQAKP